MTGIRASLELSTPQHCTTAGSARGCDRERKSLRWMSGAFSRSAILRSCRSQVGLQSLLPLPLAFVDHEFNYALNKALIGSHALKAHYHVTAAVDAKRKQERLSLVYM